MNNINNCQVVPSKSEPANWLFCFFKEKNKMLFLIGTESNEDLEGPISAYLMDVNCSLDSWQKFYLS